MLKFFITSLIIYFVYRFFLAPPSSIGPRDFMTNEKPPAQPSATKHSDDDYIDYEEVE